MKTLSAPLIAHLATGGPFLMADLYTITLASGTVLRWTDYDQDIPWGGNTFSASGPALLRGTTRTVLGVEVDTLDVNVYPKATDLVDGIGFAAAAAAGSLDGATLKLERVFLTPPATAIGTTILFFGRFADVTVARSGVAIRVNSFTEALAVMLPRNMYQAGCLHTLYDADCGAVRATFGNASTAASGSTAGTINCGLAQAASWFDRGYLLMTGGAMAGARRTIKSYVPGVITLLSPLPAAPGVGDGFTAYPGCDKSLATCTARFSNAANFRACPFIPQPETAV